VTVAGRALVTGASTGIGRALAEELARRGYDLVIVSRDEAALKTVAAHIESTYKRQVLVMSFDLSEGAAANTVFPELQRRGIKINLLVNNAGFGVHGAFSKTNLQDELRLVDLQVGALLRLTKGFLKSLPDVSKGKILNVSSIYSYVPVPYQAVYAASKSFMTSFGAALRAEHPGLVVTTLCPGSTRSEFRLRSGARQVEDNRGMDPGKVARAGLNGLERGRLVVVPGLNYRLLVWAARHAPESWLPRALRFINTRRGLIH
jgi:short-subunit dehydrogenase